MRSADREDREGRQEGQAGDREDREDRQEGQAGDREGRQEDQAGDREGRRDHRQEDQAGDREGRRDRRPEIRACRTLLKYYCLMRCISADAGIKDAAAGGNGLKDIPKKMREDYHGKDRGAFI